VHEIVLKLWRNERDKDWTLEINGERHEAVTIEWVHELAYRALLDAEESLLGTIRKPPQSGPLSLLSYPLGEHGAPVPGVGACGGSRSFSAACLAVQ